jgi:outer membrane protein assembly factor BamB
VFGCVILLRRLPFSLPRSNAPASFRGVFYKSLADRGLLLVVMFLALPVFGQETPLLTNEWYVEIFGHSDSSPAIASDGTLYFGTFNGTFWAISASGTRKWTYETGMEIMSSPAVGSNGMIYFGCRDRNLYALGPDGRKRWVFKTGGWVDASPALAGDGTVCFGSWDKHFYALNSDGTKRWQFETAGPIFSSAAIDGRGRIYFGSHDGRFYALEPDGKKTWEFATGGAILSSPALDSDGICYFTSVDGFLYALNPDGSLRWRLKTGGISAASPVIDQAGRLLVGVNERLMAISADGKIEWDRRTTPSPQSFVSGAPAVLSDGSFCFLDGNELLMVWDSQPRAKGQFYMVGHNHFASPAVGAGGTLYASGSWTNFIALHATVPLAQTPWPKFRGNPANTGRLATSGR